MSFFGAVALRPLFKVTVTEDIDEWMLPDCSAKIVVVRELGFEAV